MKNYITLVVAAGIGICGAQSIFVGEGEIRSEHVAEDATLTDTLVVSDGGSVAKTGAGTWTVPLAQIPQSMPIDFGVREGSIAILPDDADNAVSVEQPTETLNRAALWLDASAADKVLLTDAEDSTNVVAWLDVRETGNAQDGYLYPRAVANLVPAGKYPSFTEKEGTPSVYFGGFRSGETMDWVNSNGSRLVLSNIRHLFLLHGVWESYGFVVGVSEHDVNSSGTSRFHIASSGNGIPTGRLYRQMYTDAAASYTARVFQNGVRVDPCETSPLQSQFQLQELDCRGAPGIASNFFNDRNYYSPNAQFSNAGGNRIGGDYIAEAVVFTNELTEAERLSVETWLMRKWLGRSTPSCGVTTAKGASVRVSGADLSRTLQMTKGDGTVIKTGPETTLVECAPENASVASFAVEEGVVHMGTRYPLAWKSGDRYVVSDAGRGSPSHTRVADGAAGSAVKDGDGVARLTFLDDGISNIVVKAGTLAISGERLSNAIAPGGVAFGEVPAGEFEDWTGTSASLNSDGLYSGWNLVGLRGSADNYRDVVIFTSGDGSGSAWAGAASGYGSPLPAPDGSRIMMLKGNSSAWTEVTIPTEGEYDIEFNSAARKGYDGLVVDVLIGKDDDSLIQIATVTSKQAWTKRTYRTPLLTPGAYRLWFRNRAQNIDRTLALDNVRLKYRPNDAVAKMTVPNGNFEQTTAGYNTTSPAEGDYAAGWRFIAGESMTTRLLPIFVSAPTMSKYLFDHAYNRTGERQLVFSAIGSVAENTFTVSKSGNWKLKLIAAMLRWEYNSAGTSVLSGEIVRGGETLSLGEATIKSYHMRDVTLPNAVELTEGETVTLRLRVDWVYDADAAKTCVAVVDDLVFVDGAQAEAPANLIANGGFEGWSAWNFTRFPKYASYINGSTIWDYANSKANYGYAVYEGNSRATIVQNDITWCTFNAPEAGLYRLTFYAHTRMDSPSGAGDNPVTSFWVDPDVPAQTNEIAHTLVTSTNFVRCSYTFMLPQKNGLIFGLRGNYSHIAGEAELTGNDHTTLLDGVSVCRETDNLPNLPENCAIAVDPSAKLRLDYDGMVELASCRLGSALRSGEITAEKYPEYISGPGRLFVKPRNLVLIIR